ncbi:MAG: hypothetical protein QOJ69_2340 [Actinomycetota bacterium]|jgi:hypothetical protein|nr:hypothetical protein [Actinomycetota bacterium]
MVRRTTGPAVAGIAAFVLILACSACSPKQAQPEPTSTTTPASTTTAPPPTQEPATTATVTPTSGVPGGCPSGTGSAAQSAPQAARCLYQAWSDADRAGAAVFASLDVVDSLFREPWSPPEGTFEGCSATPGTSGQSCAFEHHGGRYLFDVRQSEGGWRVTRLQAP